MKAEQKQCLLKYLGYYEGDVDDQWGPLSEQATEDFQSAEGLKPDRVFGDGTLAQALDAVYHGRFKQTKATSEPDNPATDTPVTNDSNTEAPAWWKDIKYFSRDEFRCPCGKWCNGYPVEPSEKLVRFMDTMRGYFGRPVIVVPPDGHSGGSGVRCQTYNDSLKGSVTNSYHTTGKAADFSAPGVGASTIESYLTAAQAAGKIRYWYCISAGNYHVDVY